MKLAFCLFHYFPFGGLERDFLRIARACLLRGHQVDVYTSSWEGEREEGLSVEIVPVYGWQNHTRVRSFSRELQKCLSLQSYDCVMGFNKMPGLDIYYAADICYLSRIQRQRPFWYAWLPRYRQYLRNERSVFSLSAKTKILALSAVQRDEYAHCYSLPAERFELLPPGISRDRRAPENAEMIREETRQTYKIKSDEHVLLLVGSGFKTKGLDRVLRGMAALPHALKNKTRLWVIGQDHAAPFLKQAEQLHIQDRVDFLGGRHDVLQYFLAADVLVHPAYHENTGTVLLEALVSGLPVLTVDICGYAHYVGEADAGVVLSSPFEQNLFNHSMENMLLSPDRILWKRNGLAFAQLADIYNMTDKVVSIIEAKEYGGTTHATRTAPSPQAGEGGHGTDEGCIAVQKHPSSAYPLERIKNGYTHPTIQSYFSFDYFMQLEGGCYREQNGRKTQRVLLGEQYYFIKQHSGVGWKEIFKNLLQWKLPILSAKNEWQAIKRLQELSILTPIVVAYGCRGINPAHLQSFLLMEELSPVISLEDFCRDWQKQPPSFSLKYNLIHEVARIARIMHENGINHRDFYLCHFMLDIEAVSVKLYLIDLHRAGMHRKLRERWKVKDLAGLYFSSKDIGLTRHDIWRFIKAYRQQSLRDILTKEPYFWRKIKTSGESLYDRHTPSAEK